MGLHTLNRYHVRDRFGDIIKRGKYRRNVKSGRYRERVVKNGSLLGKSGELASMAPALVTAQFVKIVL